MVVSHLQGIIASLQCIALHCKSVTCRHHRAFPEYNKLSKSPEKTVGPEPSLCPIHFKGAVIVGDTIVLMVVAIVLVESSEAPGESIYPAQWFGQAEDA